MILKIDKFTFSEEYTENAIAGKEPKMSRIETPGWNRKVDKTFIRELHKFFINQHDVINLPLNHRI